MKPDQHLVHLQNKANAYRQRKPRYSCPLFFEGGIKMISTGLDYAIPSVTYS